MSGLTVEYFHGAAARVGVDATAFPHREAFNLLINSEWLAPDDTARNIAWARQMYDAMRPFSAGSSYANYMSHALKAKYDPTNLFHLN